MVMFWSVELFCWVDERVHFCAGSEDVKVGDVEYLESVRGGTFEMRRTIFFCALISFCRYVLLDLSDPQMEMLKFLFEGLFTNC